MQLLRMKRRSPAARLAFRSTLLAATLLSAPAFAQGVSADGAKQLQDSLAKTFGSGLFEKGILSIAPQGSAYAVKLDLSPTLAQLKGAGVTASFDPITYLATPNSDGTYAVTSDSPINYNFSGTQGDKPFAMKVAAPCKSAGVFDPKISTFSTYEVTCASMAMDMEDPESTVTASMGAITSKLTGTAGSGGGVNISTTGSATDFVENIVGKTKPLTIKVSAKSLASDGKVDNLQLTTVLEFIGMAANSKDPKELIGKQAEIKQKLTAALPLWNNLSGTTKLNEVTVETPLGPVKLGSLSYGVGMTGAIKDASYGIDIKYDGLALPQSPAIPGWVAPLVPGEGNIDVKFEGVDLEAIAKLAIENFDASKDPPIPDELTPQFLALFMAGQPHVTLAPSTFTAPAGAVSAEGKMSVMPSQKGKVTISATNLDQIIAAVNNAQVPNKESALMGIALIKGLAKTGADGKAVWDVDFDAATKAVSVNGQVLSPGSGGGAAPGAEGGSGDDEGDGDNAQ